eukprot:jgi/Chlat1/3788/Chrsp259S03921
MASMAATAAARAVASAAVAAEVVAPRGVASVLRGSIAGRPLPLPLARRSAAHGVSVSHRLSFKGPAAVLARSVHADAAAAIEDPEELRYRLEQAAAMSLDDSEDSPQSSEAEDAADAPHEHDVSNFGLHSAITTALRKRGIQSLFPVQVAVMQPALAGNDLIARARTGTGKTLAFGIPVIQQLMHMKDEGTLGGRGRNPKCLVLAPTRELAKQVERELNETAPSLSTACVYGGVSIRGQEQQLNKGVDVVVGTPGRIMDLMERKWLDLSEIGFVILDEADQMLAVGFEEDVEKILESVPNERQTMLFSATMPTWVQRLARKYLKKPVNIDLVGNQEIKVAEGVRLIAIKSTWQGRRSLLLDLITVYGRGAKTIVFAQTKREVDDLSVALSKSVGCEALHGDITQTQREKTLAGFRENRFSVLVATDVASRGLDISDVDLVVHYELPDQTESFLHRSGRTGRAGKQGIAIALHSDKEAGTIRELEKAAGVKFERLSAPQPSDVLAAAADQAVDMLGKVNPSLHEYFLPAAARLVEQQGAETALAAALAYLSGFKEPPQPRSLLSCEEGMVTIRVVERASKTGRSFGGLALTPRSVMLMVARYVPDGAERIGKIKLFGEREPEGAVFDVPKIYVDQILASSNEKHQFDVPKTLPRLLDEPGSSSRMRIRTGDRDGGRRDGGRDRGYGGGRGGGRGGGGGYSDRAYSPAPSRERSGGYGERFGYGGGGGAGDRRGYSASIQPRDTTRIAGRQDRGYPDRTPPKSRSGSGGWKKVGDDEMW